MCKNLWLKSLQKGVFFKTLPTFLCMIFFIIQPIFAIETQDMNLIAGSVRTPHPSKTECNKAVISVQKLFLQLAQPRIGYGLQSKRQVMETSAREENVASLIHSPARWEAVGAEATETAKDEAVNKMFEELIKKYGSATLLKMIPIYGHMSTAGDILSASPTACSETIDLYTNRDPQNRCAPVNRLNRQMLDFFSMDLVARNQIFNQHPQVCDYYKSFAQDINSKKTNYKISDLKCHKDRIYLKNKGADGTINTYRASLDPEAGSFLNIKMETSGHPRKRKRYNFVVDPETGRLKKPILDKEETAYVFLNLKTAITSANAMCIRRMNPDLNVFPEADLNNPIKSTDKARDSQSGSVN